MVSNTSTFGLLDAGTLLRGESGEIATWVDRREVIQIWSCLFTVCAGSGLFGLALGAWRSPMQAVYAGIKFPLVILLTTAGTALLNGMMAPLLGLNIKFRQSLLIILFSHTISAIILGGFSPILLFLIWNAPPVQTASAVSDGHSLVLVVEVGLIAFAGILANLRLRQLLETLSGSSSVARRVLLAWLVGNLFFGTQISWLLRPFVGSPGLPVEFLRPDAFHGNFYEAIFHAVKLLLSS